MKHDHCNADNQRIVSRLVDREVLHCMSSVIARLVELDHENDDLMTLQSGCIDFENAIHQNSGDIDWIDTADDLGLAYSIPKDPDGDDDLVIASHNAMKGVYKAVENDEINWEAIADSSRVDCEDFRREPYEFWAVTGWAAEKLRKRGECVVEICDIEVWGRPTTGQSISMDHVWWEIADSMEILVGQANDWSKQ